ncbi:helix-turn-helix domain-containing protein [Pseudonocardia sp. NPDC046786]|uniref:helix-turn-helix domain-containing protein n=1 Tax=Pseudonocardia sp. NPDC046786 TaxID=3155471 RepID=UPI0033C2B0E4
MEQLTYSVEQVAEMLGVARGVAYEQVRSGEIPAIRVGRRWLIPRNRFHAWLDGEVRESVRGVA